MITAVEHLATEGFGAGNLPYGSFAPAGGAPRLGVRLGDAVLDLGCMARSIPGISGEAASAVQVPNLDALLAAGHEVWTEVRRWIGHAIGSQEHAAAVLDSAHPVHAVTMGMPFTVADYVDYYASEHHASNIGQMFRAGQPALLPNWKHLPVGYHGRSGSIIPSGTDFPRPKGLRPEPEAAPSFGPSRKLDIEAEIGFVLGGHAPQGEVSVRRAAEEHIFGAVLLNDWSARDIQNFEYVPLGPNLGKSFATSISLWVVPMEALHAARVACPARDVPLAAYLDDSQDPWGLDITMEVIVDGTTVSNPPVGTLYWSAPQMAAHMSANGARLRPGDFFGSGTVSGPERAQRGSFMELSWGGTEPFSLGGGREMTFLEDGQRVTLRATAPGPEGSIIDFGECTAQILPAT